MAKLGKCVIANYYRKRPREKYRQDIIEQAMNNEEEAAADLEFQLCSEDIERAMERLSEPERKVIELRFWEGKSHREIARISGKAEGTIRWLASTGLKKLREEICPEEHKQNSHLKRLYIMEVKKMPEEEKKQEEEEKEKVSRRQFLKDIGLLAVAGLALSKVDLLAAEIIKNTGGGGIHPMDWSCAGQYVGPCFGGSHDCISGYVCKSAVSCQPNFSCYSGGDTTYGCTERVFYCTEYFSCQIFPNDP